MESLCCRRPIIQALFACTELQGAARSAWLSCQRTAWNGKTKLKRAHRADFWVGVGVDISLFVEEGDQSIFCLWNRFHCLSRQRRGKGSSAIASLAALLLLAHQALHLQPVCRELIPSAPCRKALMHGEGERARLGWRVLQPLGLSSDACVFWKRDTRQ